MDYPVAKFPQGLKFDDGPIIEFDSRIEMALCNIFTTGGIPSP
jgi:hypothetical protein